MPLGIVSIDEEFAAESAEEGWRRSYRICTPIRDEHSLEVQVPFLQVVLKIFAWFRSSWGPTNVDLCEALASALFRVMRGEREAIPGCRQYGPFSLLPVSPCDRAGWPVVARNLNNFDVQGLARGPCREKCEACGAGPIITTMMVSRQTGSRCGQGTEVCQLG